MVISLIYTFNSNPQGFNEVEIEDADVLQTSDKLKKFVAGFLQSEEANDLLKVSCCLMDVEDPRAIPHWYDECKGKLWF